MVSFCVVSAAAAVFVVATTLLLLLVLLFLPLLLLRLLLLLLSLLLVVLSFADSSYFVTHIVHGVLHAGHQAVDLVLHVGKILKGGKKKDFDHVSLAFS